MVLCKVDEAVDLVIFNEAVTIGVCIADAAAAPPSAEPEVDAAHSLAELSPADPAVAVGVEAPEPLLELLLRHLRRRAPHDAPPGGAATAAFDCHGVVWRFL